jgi:hypothetical protein
MELLLKDFVAKRSVRNIGRTAKMQQLAVIRYADQFVIIHLFLIIILKRVIPFNENCQALLEQWLAK